MVTNPEYEVCLRAVGESDPSVVVLDAGLATSMKTRLFAKAFPERYFNLGIAEQNAVGVASGLARRGYTPLIHSFSNFLARRAHDQVALSAAWPDCNVKFIGGSCGLFDGRNGPSHCATDDLAAMSALPGMTVVEPGDRNQTRLLLQKIAKEPGSAYLRLRRYGNSDNLLPESGTAIGTVCVKRSRDACCTIVACGSMLQEVLSAIRILEEEQLAIDLIHVSILRPLDLGPILASASDTGLLITIENHWPTGGFGDAIAREMGHLGIRHRRLHLPELFLPAGEPEWLLKFCGLDGTSIARFTSSCVREVVRV